MQVVIFYGQLSISIPHDETTMKMRYGILVLSNIGERDRSKDQIIAATLKHLKIFMQTGFICCFSESIMSSHSVSFEYAIELICCAKAW